MPIYTKKGDRGQTGLFDGTRVAKNDKRIDAIGSVDELNTMIGVVLAEIKEKKEKRKKKDKNEKRLIENLEQIQKDLFGIGAELAGYKSKVLGYKQSLRSSASPVGLSDQVLEKRTKFFEEEIDRMWKEMPELSNFILPGGSLAGAQLHLARAVCRRCERSVVAYVATMNPVMKYLNRLGDYLFCLARWVNFLTKNKETVWKAS